MAAKWAATWSDGERRRSSCMGTATFPAIKARGGSRANGASILRVVVASTSLGSKTSPRMVCLSWKDATCEH